MGEVWPCSWGHGACPSSALRKAQQLSLPPGSRHPEDKGGEWGRTTRQAPASEATAQGPREARGLYNEAAVRAPESPATTCTLH